MIYSSIKCETCKCGVCAKKETSIIHKIQAYIEDKCGAHVWYIPWKNKRIKNQKNM